MPAHRDAPPGSLRLLPAAIVTLALAYALAHVDLGWIPHDDGTVAHAASRVLRGELPHRDFDDPYTGGQALLHAGAFALLGESLLTLRLVLFGALALTTPVIYWIARRSAGPVPATAVTTLAVLWSVPTHPLPMPSWYNLFLAILAVAALLRFQDSRRRRWLVAAGGCIGASIVIKVVGLYMLAAAFLYLVFLEQEEGSAPGGHVRGVVDGPRIPAGPHRALVTGGLAVFLALLLALLRPAMAPSVLLWFFLPPGAVSATLLAREWTRRPLEREGRRALRLVGRAILVLAGAAAPVVLFLIPYALTGSLGALARGALLEPGRRVSLFLKLPPSVLVALPLGSVGVLLALAARERRLDRWLAAGLALPLTAIVALGGARPWLYQAGWWLLYPLVPAIALAGVARVVAAPGGGPARGEGRHAPTAPERFLLVAATAMIGLVAFPTFIPFYVFYAAPLVALAALTVAAPLPRAPRWSLGALLAFHVAFATLRIHRSEVYTMGTRHNPHPPAERLALERGRIRVTPGENAAYRRLMEALERVGAGPYVWATPDAPEIYFLSGRNNPTRTFFDFLDEDFYSDPPGRAARVARLLEEHGVRAVVVKRSPTLASPPLSGALLDTVVARYPRATELGPFVVFWRAPDGGAAGESAEGRAGGGT